MLFVLVSALRVVFPIPTEAILYKLHKYPVPEPLAMLNKDMFI